MACWSLQPPCRSCRSRHGSPPGPAKGMAPSCGVPARCRPRMQCALPCTLDTARRAARVCSAAVRPGAHAAVWALREFWHAHTQDIGRHNIRSGGCTDPSPKANCVWLIRDAFLLRCNASPCALILLRSAYSSKAPRALSARVACGPQTNAPALRARAWAWPQARAQSEPEAEGRARPEDTVHATILQTESSCRSTVAWDHDCTAGYPRKASSPCSSHAKKSTLRTVNIQLTYS